MTKIFPHGNLINQIAVPENVINEDQVSMHIFSSYVRTYPQTLIVRENVIIGLKMQGQLSKLT